MLAELKLAPKPKHQIILSAHIDHLGHGEWMGSRAHSNEHRAIHPGADDNASGVAVLLLVAQRLAVLHAQNKLQGERNIVFAVWTGEELGVLGSSHYVKTYFKKKAIPLSEHTDAIINLDMVGRLKDKLIIQGVGSSAHWPNILKQATLNAPITLSMQQDPYLPTDTTPFYLAGVPILNFFSGAHDDYHTPRDTADKLNYEGMKNISEVLVNLIIALENHPQAIAYQAITKKHHAARQSFNVYLGTIPDYASQNNLGVRLSGVIHHSPAERAGLQSGDIIVHVASQKIQDVYEYTDALHQLQPHQAVNIIALRNHTAKTFQVIPEAR